MTTIWRSRGLRWGIAVSGLITMAMASVFLLITSEASGMLSSGIDRSVTEQLSLLDARPTELLPFMITSRQNGGAAVVTQVGLFSADRTYIVGALTSIPEGLPFDGAAHRARSADATVPLRAAGKVTRDGRLLVVARDASDVIAIREAMFATGLRLALPTLLLTLAGGLVLGLYGERRLRQINETADRIIRGDLTLRLPDARTGDELDRLCSIFNRVLNRLEQGIEALRGAGENIAHDLRTPLTSVRARLERALQSRTPEPALSQILEQSVAGIDQCLSTITSLLRIADLENVRRTSAFRSFPLHPMLRETTEIFAPLAEDRGVALTCTSPRDVEIVADRDLLVEAVANLLDNAIKFTPPGGSVCVTLAEGLHGASIVVADSGPGIPVAMRGTVLNRFVKLDSSRRSAGYGLGLSLVKAICDLHHFTLDIGGDGSGAVIRIDCFASS